MQVAVDVWLWQRVDVLLECGVITNVRRGRVTGRVERVEGQPHIIARHALCQFKTHCPDPP